MTMKRQSKLTTDERSMLESIARSAALMTQVIYRDTAVSAMQDLAGMLVAARGVLRVAQIAEDAGVEPERIILGGKRKVIDFPTNRH